MASRDVASGALDCAQMLKRRSILVDSSWEARLLLVRKSHSGSRCRLCSMLSQLSAILSGSDGSTSFFAWERSRPLTSSAFVRGTLPTFRRRNMEIGSPDAGISYQMSMTLPESLPDMSVKNEKKSTPLALHQSSMAHHA